MKLKVTPEWLRNRIESDPDMDFEVGTPDEQIVKRYRCGWCGMITNGNGTPLSLDTIEKDELFEWDNAELVNGSCCG